MSSGMYVRNVSVVSSKPNHKKPNLILNRKLNPQTLYSKPNPRALNNATKFCDSDRAMRSISE